MTSRLTILASRSDLQLHRDGKVQMMIMTVTMLLLLLVEMMMMRQMVQLHQRT